MNSETSIRINYSTSSSSSESTSQSLNLPHAPANLPPPPVRAPNCTLLKVLALLAGVSITEGAIIALGYQAITQQESLRNRVKYVIAAPLATMLVNSLGNVYFIASLDETNPDPE